MEKKFPISLWVKEKIQIGAILSVSSNYAPAQRNKTGAIFKPCMFLLEY